MRREPEVGDLLYYTLRRERDPHWRGISTLRLMACQVVRVTPKRVTIRPYPDGFKGQPDRLRVVSRDTLREL